MALRLCSLLLAGALLIPAQAPPPDSQDAVLRDQVSLALTLDRDVLGGGIQVTVSKGAVVLKGPIRTQKAKDKATKLAQKVKGVKSVDNQLKLPNDK